MTFSRQDFENSLAERRGNGHAAGRSLQDLQMLMQAGLSAEAVTNHPDWDRLLSFLQAAIEETEKQCEMFRAVLESSEVVNAEQLAAARQQLLLCKERIKAWRVLIDLPRMLMENAATVIDIIERMEGDKQAS